MAKSTDHYAKALEHARALDLYRDEDPEFDRTGMSAAMHVQAGQLHALLAQVALAYEERAVTREKWVWAVHPDGREFSSAEDAEAAGAVYVDYQHPDGTQEDDALVLDGAPLVYEERTVPANDYARALAAQL